MTRNTILPLVNDITLAAKELGLVTLATPANMEIIVQHFAMTLSTPAPGTKRVSIKELRRYLKQTIYYCIL
ncbi:hypothetical protein [Nissabacter sp. SGAir0207]|uniref:hypothetical protein n=1 Tax=Nissabacter sp. SGAir0207 TaxID=2126321 RepID=UPI0010F8059B|nr:hypothetical protein [Nissabacter sp. SGAir0207]